MINIALCFENNMELSYMQMELSRCFDLRGIDYNLNCYHTAAELKHGIQRRFPDLFFYDIMGEYGLVRMAALSLKEINPRLVSVVFHNRHYIKPPNDTFLEPLYIIPNKSTKQLWTYALLAYEATLDKENVFSYYRRPSYLYAPYDNIKYFVSEGRRTRIVCENEKHNNSFYKKLNDVETYVSSKQHAFLRIHQSYLINTKYVAAYNRSHVMLTTGEYLPISKYEYYKEICNHIAEKKTRCGNRLHV